MNAAARRALYERLRAANPEPRSELVWRMPFELLVAVVLSAQATDRSVNEATARLFPVANTPQAIVALGVRRLQPYLRRIGLWRTKARNLVALSRRLIERHAGQVPTTRAELEALPGVGRKTANVLLNALDGAPTIAVDTHVFRVANRTGLARGRTPREVEEALLRVTPPEYARRAHHWLVLHGRYVCTARRPRCAACLLRDLCEYPGKTDVRP